MSSRVPPPYRSKPYQVRGLPATFARDRLIGRLGVVAAAGAIVVCGWAWGGDFAVAVSALLASGVLWAGFALCFQKLTLEDGRVLRLGIIDEYLDNHVVDTYGFVDHEQRIVYRSWLW